MGSGFLCLSGAGMQGYVIMSQFWSVWPLPECVIGRHYPVTRGNLASQGRCAAKTRLERYARTLEERGN